jgi:hypothetical protein
MPKSAGSFLDNANADTPEGLIEVIPMASLGAFDPYSDIFAPAASLFSAEAAPIVAGPTIHLLVGESWPTLIDSVMFQDLKEKVNSSTSYTISDAKAGLSVEFTGSNFTSVSVPGFTTIETGTITGFKVKLNGVSIAVGSGYSLTAYEIQGYAQQALLAGNALPFFALWFSNPTTVSGTAAVIKSSLSLIAPYVDLATVEITDGPLVVNVAKFDKYEAVLNTVVGGFEVSDSVADVKAALIASGSALAADYADVSSLVLTNGATALLRLTTAQDTAAASLLAKVSGNSIIAVEDTSGAWVTSGKGNGLTINDIAGVDAITGGGSSESFVFAAHWGQASISDFDSHFKGIGHDFVTLAKSEFAHGDKTLMADAAFTGGSIVVTAGTDQLTFTGMTTADFDKAILVGDFKFV